jgi:miniconductance mechanosensitive channel
MKQPINQFVATTFGFLDNNPLISFSVLVLISCALGIAIYWGIGIIFRRFVKRFQFDKDMIHRDTRFLRRFAYLSPALVFHFALPYILSSQSRLYSFIEKGLAIYIVAILAVAIDSLLNVILDIHRTRSQRKWILTNGIVQTLKIVDYTLSIILIFAVVFDKSVLYLLSGLGALTAVSMIVFKDAMLGFVAGLQLSANRMIKHGDWIEMPKFGVDGEVVEIDLSTIRVRNWDKTITTVPTYALISDSFKNWRGMEESGLDAHKGIPCLCS